MALRIVFGDFELDEARFELRRCNERVTMQPRVLELILYLANNRHRVVDKDELFETLWDGTTVTDASLNRAVSLARKALDDTPTAERAIRTVRGKGLQFVATTRAPAATVPHDGGGTELETAQDEARTTERSRDVPFLYAALHGESPREGGASWSLADVDEVHIVRGSRRKTQRELGLTRVLSISIPGRLLSRKHARIVRGPEGWWVVDEGSRNGTFVNGEAVKKRALAPGDMVECGRTIFLLATEPWAHRHAQDAERPSMFATVTPRLLAVEKDLVRLAPSSLPVLLSGESGTGKSHLAETLHHLSARAGPLVRLDAGAMRGLTPDARNAALAPETTLLLESIERADDGALITDLLERAPDARVISTSREPFERLQERAPHWLARLAGYHCALPPLRERVADMGVLIAALSPSPPSIEPTAARALMRHRWPGNLHELTLVLRAASVLAGEGSIRVEHLPAELRAG